MKRAFSGAEANGGIWGVGAVPLTTLITLGHELVALQLSCFLVLWIFGHDVSSRVYALGTLLRDGLLKGDQETMRADMHTSSSKIMVMCEDRASTGRMPIF